MLPAPGLEDNDLIEEYGDARGPGPETLTRKRRHTLNSPLRSPGGTMSDVDLPDDPAASEVLALAAPSSHFAASVAAVDAAARATAVDEESLAAAAGSSEPLG